MKGGSFFREILGILLQSSQASFSRAKYIPVPDEQ
jgi:hypothetical protein